MALSWSPIAAAIGPKARLLPLSSCRTSRSCVVHAARTPRWRKNGACTGDAPGSLLSPREARRGKVHPKAGAQSRKRADLSMHAPCVQGMRQLLATLPCMVHTADPPKRPLSPHLTPAGASSGNSPAAADRKLPPVGERDIDVRAAV
jgi:hypothetical protein